MCIALDEMLYQHALCTMVPQHISHTDPHTTTNHDHLEQHASLSAANHDHQGCLTEGPSYLPDRLYLFSMMPDACGSLPLSSLHSRPWIIQCPSHQQISSGQNQHAHNHICECHPDASQA